MLFDSPIYFVFLIPVVLIYWRLGRREQNIFLLCASYFFYGWWDWRFLALMICSTSVDFLIAQRITPESGNVNRRKWLKFRISEKMNHSLRSQATSTAENGSSFR